jgi:hypothetical protein
MNQNSKQFTVLHSSTTTTPFTTYNYNYHNSWNIQVQPPTRTVYYNRKRSFLLSTTTITAHTTVYVVMSTVTYSIIQYSRDSTLNEGCNHEGNGMNFLGHFLNLLNYVSFTRIFVFRCIFGMNECKINRFNRTNCKQCRYTRCLEVSPSFHFFSRISNVKFGLKGMMCRGGRGHDP